MENERRYKLGKYILTEYDDMLLVWATNTAFGGQRTGHCLVIGNILVILPWERKEIGYLRLEFHITHTKLPIWEKTKYYCYSSDIRQIEKPRGLEKSNLKHLSVNSGHPPVHLEGPCSYRLGRHKIIVNGNKVITWQIIGESGGINCGECCIESGILFLCPKTEELAAIPSRSFTADAKALPVWNATCAWGHQESLLTCESPKPKGSTLNIWYREHSRSSVIRSFPLLSKMWTE